MGAAISKLAAVFSSKMGSGEKSTLIVRSLRTVYAGGAAGLVVTWYTAWRNERIEPGTGDFPFPGVRKLRERFGPDRGKKDTDPGYTGPVTTGGGGGGMRATNDGGALSFTGGGRPGPPEWGGSKAVADALVAGLPWTDKGGKRGVSITTSGNVSDHSTTARMAFAWDCFASVEQMDKNCREILSRLGLPSTGSLEETVITTEKGGYRIQILYRTYTGGDHYDHIHVGVEKQ